ncbi:MAG: NMD3-related protein, partial [Candidatus Hadarchaeales archaeon]
MERFCYICGEKEKPSSPLIEGLCQKCFADRFKMLVVPKKISLTVCKGCGMYFWKGAWIKPSDVEDIVRSAVLQEVSVANLVDGERVLVPLCSADVEATVIPRPKAGVAEVEVRGKSHKNQAEPKTEKAEIKVEIFRKLCKTCSLKAAGRYEAVLQLRGVRGDEPIEEAAGIIQGVIAT